MEYTTLVSTPEFFGLKTIHLSSGDLEEEALIIEVKNSIGKEGSFVLPDGKGYNLSTGEKTENFKMFTFASVQKAIDWYGSTQANHQVFAAHENFPHS